MEELDRRVHHEWSFAGECTHDQTLEKARQDSPLCELLVVPGKTRPRHKLHLATGNMFIADESSSIVAMRSMTIRSLSNFAGRQAEPLRMLI